MNNQRQDIDVWKKVVEKAVDAKAKTGFQPHSIIREIDSRCPKEYRPSVKKNKNDAYRKHRDKVSKDKEKAKSHLLSSANQPQNQASKNNKRHGSRRTHLATRVNAIEVAKKDKDKAKNLSHIKCCICKQKGHHANMCPKKPKN